jgi:hypothetical protein
MELDLHDTEGARYAGIGALGGAASGLPSIKSLRWYQFIGCVLAGGFVARFTVPIIPLIWHEVPSEVRDTSAAFIGLGGTGVLAMGTAWWEMIRKRNYFQKFMAQRFGTPVDETPTPLPPTKTGGK